MYICFLVYREDNAMVFESQVLEYLERMKDKVENIELIVFRHESNLLHKRMLEGKMLNYVKECKTFVSFPPITEIQLKIDAIRLQKYVQRKYKNKQVAVICRGDLAAYLGTYAFRNNHLARTLYDNRGLSIEESLLSHESSLIHRMNRSVKKFAVKYAKSHCDAYNFVTNNLRNYDITHYGYSEDIPYTVIPTLIKRECFDDSELDRIKRNEHYKCDELIITYIGSTAAWQSIDCILNTIQQIYNHDKNTRFFILTNGIVSAIKRLPDELQNRICVKQVSHDEIKYYLQMTDVGIVMRSDSIVNKVAAPTKIAELLAAGVQVLYSGEIGIFSDLRTLRDDLKIINIDTNENWLNLLQKKNAVYDASTIVDYFDMDKRQYDTMNLLGECFKNRKN